MGDGKKKGAKHKAVETRGRSSSASPSRGRPPKIPKTEAAAATASARAVVATNRERRLQWGRGIEQHGHRKGEKFSVIHTAFLLVLVLGVLSTNEDGGTPLTPTDACHYCASLMHVNWHYFMDVYNCWMNHSALLEYEYEKRGFGSTKFIAQSARLLGADHIKHIQEFVDGRNKEAGSCSIPRIQVELERVFDLHVPKLQIHRALGALGYKYVHVRGAGRVIDTEARTLRIRKYLLELHLALKAELRGDAVIVYMDESYVHQNHALGMSWVKEGEKAEVGRSTSKGKRLIIVHAITKDGPLSKKDDNGRPIK